MSQMQEAERLLLQFQGLFGTPGASAPEAKGSAELRAEERPLARLRPPATPAQAATLPLKKDAMRTEVQVSHAAPATSRAAPPAVIEKSIVVADIPDGKCKEEPAKAKAAPTTLVFRGGGSSCAAYAGIARRLGEAKMLSGVLTFIGISGGAQAAALMAFGYTGQELAEALRQTPRRQLLDYAGFPCGACRNFFRLFRHYGVCKGDALEGHLDGLFKQKFGKPRCTLRQLHEWSGKELRLGAFNMTTQELEFLDRHTHPDMPVCVAVRASSSMPVLFRPVRAGRALYVDGGLQQGLPISGFTDGGQVLALNLCTGRSGDAQEKPPPPASFIQFLSSSLHALKESSQGSGGLRACAPGASASSSIDVLDIDIGKAGAVGADVPAARLDELDKRGYNAIAGFLRPTTE